MTLSAIMEQSEAVALMTSSSSTVDSVMTAVVLFLVYSCVVVSCFSTLVGIELSVTFSVFLVADPID